MANKQKYIRLAPDMDNPTALQTATVRFQPVTADGSSPALDQPPYVDIIGAVHVGDAEYYHALQKQFADYYDVVLFEVVANPEELEILTGKAQKGMPGFNPMRFVQQVMGHTLQLTHQMEQVDYSAPNFVHADMSKEELDAAMSAEGTSMIQMFIEAYMESMNMQKQDPEAAAALMEEFSMINPFELIFGGGESARRLKRGMAKQMAGQLEGGELPLGTTMNRFIIEKRDEVVIERLKEALEAGNRRIGIFYGAGHGPDLEQRLKNELGLVITGEDWLTAWDLEPRETAGNSPFGGGGSGDPISDFFEGLFGENGLFGDFFGGGGGGGGNPFDDLFGGGGGNSPFDDLFGPKKPKDPKGPSGNGPFDR